RAHVELQRERSSVLEEREADAVEPSRSQLLNDAGDVDASGKRRGPLHHGVLAVDFVSHRLVRGIDDRVGRARIASDGLVRSKANDVWRPAVELARCAIGAAFSLEAYRA